MEIGWGSSDRVAGNRERPNKPIGTTQSLTNYRRRPTNYMHREDAS